MNAEQIYQKMEELNLFVQDAEASAREGNIVDIKRLDREVGILCQQALSLPQDDARQIQPMMAEMIGNLDRLGNALRDFKDRHKKR